MSETKNENGVDRDASPAALERLVAFMGWEVVTDKTRLGTAVLDGETVAYRFTAGAHVGEWGTTPSGQPWNPLVDANADAAVLARARQMWGTGRQRRLADEVRQLWFTRWGYQADTETILRYEPGDWSRAVLAVLSPAVASPSHTEG